MIHCISFFFQFSLVSMIILSNSNLHNMNLTKHKTLELSAYFFYGVYLTFDKICCMMINSSLVMKIKLSVVVFNRVDLHLETGQFDLSTYSPENN